LGKKGGKTRKKMVHPREKESRFGKKKKWGKKKVYHWEKPIGNVKYVQRQKNHMLQFRKEVGRKPRWAKSMNRQILYNRGPLKRDSTKELKRIRTAISLEEGARDSRKRHKAGLSLVGKNSIKEKQVPQKCTWAPL